MLPVSLHHRFAVLSYATCRHLLVYWKSQPHVLSNDQQLFVPVEAPALKITAKVVVLARQHYQEFLRIYPITDAKELKSVLKQEFAESPYVLHQFDYSEPNQTKVCTFILDPAAIENCPGWVYFPETMLLAHAPFASDQEERLWDCTKDHGFYFYCRDGLSVSQKQGPICASPAMFMLNNGLPEDLVEQVPSPQAYTRALVSGLKNCLIRGRSFGCWVIQKDVASGFNLKKWLLMSSGLLLAYLLIVTLYMHFGIESRKTAIAGLGDGVNQLLDSQSKQKELAESFDLFLKNKSGLSHISPVWGIVQVMLESKVSLFSFSIEDDRLTLRGSAPRATEVLATLLKIPDVASAEFTAPVRNDNGVEAFVISVSFTVNTDIESGGGSSE